MTQKINGHTWDRGKVAFQMIVEMKVHGLLESAYVLSSGASISQSSGRLRGAGTGKLLLTNHQQDSFPAKVGFNSLNYMHSKCIKG